MIVIWTPGGFKKIGEFECATNYHSKLPSKFLYDSITYIIIKIIVRTEKATVCPYLSFCLIWGLFCVGHPWIFWYFPVLTSHLTIEGSLRSIDAHYSPGFSPGDGYLISAPHISTLRALLNKSFVCTFLLNIIPSIL